MSKGFAVDFGACGFGWSGRPPSLRLGVIAFYWFEHGIGIIMLGYRASLRIEREKVKR
ncbi:hypothetical protein IGS75_01350 [Gluconobacter sphaericus]|uniref:hypothetical protein n=1 Tax=Gluconobacter sphaericus TaxID=574987 RepID=UPI001920E0F3|nr:hypothetical protein [Gluconobacter sphaericus]QQX91316.1 hypothetical protein IGS75_01350 [Gluconobacter sphaericus]